MIEYITCAAAVVAACCSLIRVIGGATREAEAQAASACSWARMSAEHSESANHRLLVAIAALPKKRKPRAKPPEPGEVTQ